MARISLIYFDINTGHAPGLHNGLASLAAAVRQKGHILEFHHILNDELSEHLLINILKFNPDIVGFSFVTNQRKHLDKYSKAISKRTKVLQIAGGIHATVDPMDVFEGNSISGVCIGEGEQTLSDLLERFDTDKSILGTPGFWWRAEDGTIKKNSIPPLNPDLSKLPYPDYSIFKVSEINRANSGWMAMIVTRGCPYNCSYCANHVLRAIYPNKKDYIRVPTVEYALGLIKNNLSSYPGVKGIIFIDDLLVWNKKWFMEFAERFRNEIGLPFTCNVRVEYVTKDICAALKKSGCILAQTGIESGNEWLRKYLLNRYISNDQIIAAFRLLKDFDIPRFSYNILGFPFETKALMEETLSLNKRVKPDTGIVYYFFPYPGTRLHAICKEFGLLNKTSAELSGYLERPAINLTHCKTVDCVRIYHKLMLYLLSRWATKKLKFVSSFASICLYTLFNIYPSFFVNLFTKESKCKRILRRIAYRNYFIKSKENYL